MRLAIARSSRRAIRDRRRHRDRDVDPDVGGTVRQAPQGCLDRVSERHGVERDGQRAGLEPAGIEQVADEPVEAVGLLVDRRVHLGELLGLPHDRSVEQAGGERLDRGQWRAEVVRHRTRAAPYGHGRPRRAPERAGRRGASTCRSIATPSWAASAVSTRWSSAVSARPPTTSVRPSPVGATPTSIECSGQSSRPAAATTSSRRSLPVWTSRTPLIRNASSIAAINRSTGSGSAASTAAARARIAASALEPGSPRRPAQRSDRRAHRRPGRRRRTPPARRRCRRRRS